MAQARQRIEAGGMINKTVSRSRANAQQRHWCAPHSGPRKASLIPGSNISLLALAEPCGVTCHHLVCNGHPTQYGVSATSRSTSTHLHDEDMPRYTSRPQRIQ
jgi:hypothetical protein